MAIPLKQGLKPYLTNAKVRGYLVDMAIPLKQGLKHEFSLLANQTITALIWQFH